MSRKEQKKLEEIFNLLRKHSTRQNEDDNKAAKLALYQCLNLLYQLKPNDNGKLDFRTTHCSYMQYLIEAQVALQKRQYQQACNSLSSLIYHHCHRPNNGKPIVLLQPRHFYNLIALLEDYL